MLLARNVVNKRHSNLFFTSNSKMKNGCGDEKKYILVTADKEDKCYIYFTLCRKLALVIRMQPTFAEGFPH